jgi:glycosyltransferase involved in cell wall biosynthesis
VNTAEGSVAVVIPARDAQAFLCDAIESVFEQTVAVQEIVVVDDGSTDGTPRVAATYRDRVNLVRQEPRGLPSARNQGVSATRASMILFLDADDILRPDCVERLTEKMNSNPALGLVHGGFAIVDKAQHVVGYRLDGVSGDPRRQMLLPRSASIHGGGTGTLVRRYAFEAVEGFDEKMTHSEDWDFFYRVGSRFEIGFVCEPVFAYRVYDGNMHHNINRMRESMLYAYGKAFSTADPGILSIKRQAYARLHSTIAGSYLHAGQPLRSLEHVIRAGIAYPPQLGYAARLPLRRYCRTPR